MGRINNRDTFDGRKPELAIPRFAACRLKSARTLQRRQAIRFAVGFTLDAGALSIGKFGQFRLIDAEHASKGGEPEKSPAIIENAVDDVVHEAIARCASNEPVVLVAAQSAIQGADPKSAITIRQQGTNRVAGQAIRMRKAPA